MPDLYTNLVLNDSRFKKGIQDAEARSRSFENAVNGVSKAARSFNNVMKLGGWVGVIMQGTAAWESFAQAQVRVAQGQESFYDRWIQSKSAIVQAADNLGIFHDTLVKVLYLWDNGPMGEMQENAARAINERVIQTKRELEGLRAKSAAEKQLIDLKWQEVTATMELSRLSAQAQRAGAQDINLIRQLYSAKRAAIEASERDEARKKDLARVDKKVAFNEMIEQEDIALLRAQGKEKEARRMEIEAEARRRIRELGRDQTLPGAANDERTRRLAEIMRVRDEQLYLLEKKTPQPYDRSISFTPGAGGAAGLLGQVFAVGARAPFAKAEETLKAVEKNTAAEVRLLKSIDAGIKHVGVYR